MDVRDSYQSSFAELERRSTATPSWLRDLRQRGLESFRAVGFPTSRLEDWKYTNIAPLVKAPFEPVLRYERNGLGPDRLARIGLGTFAAIRIVVVDGHFVADLSDLGPTRSGVEVGSLAAAIARGDAEVAGQLGKHAAPEHNGFVALNTAFLHDGVFVRIHRGTIVEGPIHIVFVTTAHAERTATYPRALILAAENSGATVIESHVSDGSAAYLCDAITEIVAADNASLDHTGVVWTNDSALHVGTVAVEQQRASQVTLHSFALHGGTIRNEVTVRLAGEGAECTLNGLFVGGGRSHIDSHTTIEHVKPACTSQELYKGVLAGSAMGVFNGLIRVHADAQKTVARQASKNLLLSGDAQINTKPQLEIHADDVKCNHGSTIGQLDDDAVFYLRSRGLDLAAAYNLLTNAFAGEMVGRVKCEPLRARLEEELRACMPQRA